MPPGEDTQAALEDVGDSFAVEVAAAFVVDDTGKAIRNKRKRAAAAQQPQTLVVAAPLRQRRKFKQALRRADAELRGRLQIMRMHGAAAEDGASSCDV